MFFFYFSVRLSKRSGTKKELNLYPADDSINYIFLKPKKPTSIIKKPLLPLYTKSPITLSSRLFKNMLPLEKLLCIRTELRTLVLSDFDSIQGIPVEANQPLGCKEPVINLTRPAVLRVYFGVSKRCTDTLNCVRPTYGPISTASSVGMDPYNFTTKSMSLNLFLISEHVRKLLMEKIGADTPPSLHESFNHCTVLIYSGSNNNGCSNSSLSFHSDCTFDHKGKYVTNRNSQKENTCVVVLTVGDCREIFFKKRVVVEGNQGRHKWRVTDDESISFLLEDNSVFLLHPMDEIPSMKEGDNLMSQYIHGGINVESPNILSFALVFRVVCVEREYDPITSKLIPMITDLKASDNTGPDDHSLLWNALKEFRCNNLKSYSTTFHNFVRSKFKEWNW